MSFVVDLASVVVVVGIGWFIVRWKWRQIVARNREMRRRMALAAAEASRAELEATNSYHSYGFGSESVVEEPLFPAASPERQVQYTCQLCRTPTTTRCKQCKSVHYCSGKCQIIHWRQGHKEDCSILRARRKSDAEVHSHVYEFHNAAEFDGLKTDEAFELSNSTPGGSRENEGDGTETAGARRADMGDKILFDSVSDVSARSPAHASGIIVEELNGTGRSVPMSFEAVKLISAQRLSPTNRGNCNFSSTSDEKSLSSVSSDSSLLGSEDHSLSEPSTPSCGFWEESNDRCSSKIDTVDDGPCSSNEPDCKSRLQPPSSELSGLNGQTGSSLHFSSNKRPELASSRVMENIFREQKPRKPAFGWLQPNEPDLKSRLQPLSSKLSAQNDQVGSSSRFSSNERPELVSSRNMENMYKEQKPNEATFRCSAPQFSQERRPDRDSIVVEARQCQINKSELSKSCVFSTPRENEKACKNNLCLMDRFEYPEADAAARFSYFNRQIGNSHIVRRGSSCTGVGIMDTHKGSFSYEQFVKLYNWNEVELCPCGLVNCGNSCYANAVLQCLVFTPPLTAYFLQGLHSKHCERNEWCFSCEFEDLVIKVNLGRYPVSPSRIMSKIDSIGSHLVHGREEDAHEFLRYAIDCMQLACLREAGAKVPPTPVDEETTLLSFTFGGYLRSKIECMRCGCMSEQHERMMDLAVEIGGDVSTLEDALAQFTRSEILDGENKYLCSRCNSYEKAKKKLRVLEAPNVLTIALKRFQCGKYGKLNKRVEFPEILDLAPYMSGTSDKSPIYRLYGVMVHLDYAISGHYLCYVQNNRRKWFEANDSTVEEVNLKKVLSRDAYMLFYTRCSPRSPRLARSLVLHRDPRKEKTGKIEASHHPWNASSVAELSGYKRNNTNSCCSDESSSEYSSSFFSDVGSYGTETSNGESASSCENLDQIAMWD